MKVIAVLIPTFTIEYSLDILSGIADYFRDKEVKVVIIQTRIPGVNQGAFDYQYCTGFEYAKSKEVDAVICVSGIYASQMPEEKLREMLREFEHRPIVSIALDPQSRHGYTILADCRKSIKDIVNHLKREHDCKKIAFFSRSAGLFSCCWRTLKTSLT